MINKTINKEITKFFKDGGTIKKIKPSERAMKEYVWHQETYPINYKMRYHK
jgi:hypothetical protein|tara:strand:- start:972 stop:1124 length:153 start_codon:yes stop_codon:yes gene_type:complete